MSEMCSIADQGKETGKGMDREYLQQDELLSDMEARRKEAALYES